MFEFLTLKMLPLALYNAHYTREITVLNDPRQFPIKEGNFLTNVTKKMAIFFWLTPIPMVTLFGLKSVFRHTLYIFTWSFSLSHYMYNWNPFLYSLLFCCSSGIPFDIFRLIVCEYRLFCLAEPTQWVNGKFYIQTFSQKYLTHLLWYFNDQRKNDSQRIFML